MLISLLPILLILSTPRVSFERWEFERKGFESWDKYNSPSKDSSNCFEFEFYKRCKKLLLHISNANHHS